MCGGPPTPGCNCWKSPRYLLFVVRREVAERMQWHVMACYDCKILMVIQQCAVVVVWPETTSFANIVYSWHKLVTSLFCQRCRSRPYSHPWPGNETVVSEFQPRATGACVNVVKVCIPTRLAASQPLCASHVLVPGLVSAFFRELHQHIFQTLWSAAALNTQIETWRSSTPCCHLPLSWCQLFGSWGTWHSSISLLKMLNIVCWIYPHATRTIYACTSCAI